MVHLVDSSIWIALFLDNDTQHAKAARTVDGLRGRVLVPYCILSETATVLAYKQSKSLADAFCRYCVDADHIEVINNRWEDECAFFLRLGARISFPDATLLFLANALPATLHTFDRQLARLARRLKDAIAP